MFTYNHGERIQPMAKYCIHFICILLLYKILHTIRHYCQLLFFVLVNRFKYFTHTYSFNVANDLPSSFVFFFQPSEIQVMTHNIFLHAVNRLVRYCVTTKLVIRTALLSMGSFLCYVFLLLLINFFFYLKNYFFFFKKIIF